MTPLLAWSQDDILAHRSGYQVLADYLEAPRVVHSRRDPAGGWPLLQTRLNRRLAFSRWITGGSLEVERELGRSYSEGNLQAVHYLWCDRDLGFFDILARSTRLQLIGTFHQCPDDLPKVIRRSSSLRHFAAIILMSETQRDYFLHNGVSPERMHVIHHGVDVEHFTPVTLEAPENFTVLSVGGTRRDFVQMAAVAEALQAEKNIRLIFVGPGDKASSFQDMAHLSYHPRVSDAELMALYRSASCFLHLPENATANNALLEAMSCGAPVITQRVGGVPEYVSKSCAFIADAGDAASTVRSIKELSANRALQTMMRHEAREHAVKHDWRLVAEQTRQVYASLC